MLEVLGAVDIDLFSEMLTCINEGQVSRGIKLIEKVILDGKDLNQFVINFTWFLRNIMLIKTTENTRDLVDVTEEKLMELRKQSVDVNLDSLMRYIRIFSDLSNQLKFSTQKRVLLEAAFIKLCKPQMEEDVESLLNRINVLKKKLENGIVVNSDKVDSIASETQTREVQEDVPVYTEEQKKEIVKALPEEIKELARGWQQVVNKTPMSIRGSLAMATPYASEDGTLVLVFENDFDYSMISREMHLTEIKNIIISLINKEVTIKTQLKSHSNENSDNLVNIAAIIHGDITYEE